MWPWGASLGTTAPSQPAFSWHTSFLSLGPDPRVGGLFPFAGWLQEEQAEMASAGRAAGEDAGERGQRPGQAQLRSTRASVASRRMSASARGAGHCPGVVCASTAVFLFLHNFESTAHSVFRGPFCSSVYLFYATELC